MSKAEILTKAEEFVRAALSKDLKQKADDQTVKAIAKKVARSVPASRAA